MSVVVRNVKVLGDMFHLVSYPFLFWSFRHDRRVCVSFNSQMLFFLALLFRYAAVLTDTSEMLDSVKVLSGLRGNLSIGAVVQIYKKKHATYSFLLRLLPLLSSAAAVLRLSTSVHHWEPGDRLNWKVLLLPCLAGAVLLHHHMNPPVTKQDPWQVLKTSSYFIETVAIIPQLYLDHGLRHAQYAAAGYLRPGRGRGGDGAGGGYGNMHYVSSSLEAHLLTRGL